MQFIKCCQAKFSPFYALKFVENLSRFELFKSARDSPTVHKICQERAKKARAYWALKSFRLNENKSLNFRQLSFTFGLGEVEGTALTSRFLSCHSIYRCVYGLPDFLDGLPLQAQSQLRRHHGDPNF